MAAVEQQTRRFDAGHAGHADIEKDDIGFMLSCQFHCLHAVFRFRHDFQRGPAFLQAGA